MEKDTNDFKFNNSNLNNPLFGSTGIKNNLSNNQPILDDNRFGNTNIDNTKFDYTEKNNDKGNNNDNNNTK